MNKKYNLEFKLQLIKEYKTGPLGYELLSKKYNIHDSYIRTWIYQYDTFGIKGLTAGMKKRKYSQEEKVEILEYRLKHQLSYKETAKKFNIVNPNIIAQWQKKLNEYGILGLKPKPKGRVPKTMKKKNTETNNQPLNETEREELERLRHENKLLEIQIELEKKLQSLARKNQTRK
ncbi:transposase [Staphylococcus piscifermentans]|uniref:DNA-binding protein n=1 Tax=Staphylococcus piscifermentans TaxID=70258 RepID=A0A239U3A4_9STAP|nr:helix-turn-helix domain-containing protein [Staphylococcus piscifermentans]RTX83887.1 transposase [Staphylococcus piscifermentans]GEP83497.1 DNA-binding protein [Staphylococcus piscifermentans]SNV04611.1 transposase [Staphylococcus piscifermentans]